MADANIFETIKAITVLDENNKRLFGKYFDKEMFPTNKDSLRFEQTLLKRVKKPLDTNDEIIDHFDGYTVVGQKAIDAYIFIVGDDHENELTLTYILQSIMDALNSITQQGQMLDKSQLLQNYNKVLVIFDEAISDNGVILEASSNKLMDRITSDRQIVNTEDELINEIGNSTLKFLKQWM